MPVRLALVRFLGGWPPAIALVSLFAQINCGLRVIISVNIANYKGLFNYQTYQPARYVDGFFDGFILEYFGDFFI